MLQIKIKCTNIINIIFKLILLSLQSSDPTWMPTEEDVEEEELDETVMSPAAKLLKLGAEDTVNISNYLLHFLGRELEEVIYIFFSILKQTKLTICTTIS